MVTIVKISPTDPEIIGLQKIIFIETKKDINVSKTYSIFGQQANHAKWIKLSIAITGKQLRGYSIKEHGFQYTVNRNLDSV